MDRIAIIVFLLIAICNNSLAQIRFDTTLFEKSVSSDSDSLLHFSFKFQNTGKNPIKLTKLETSCSCTLAKLEKEIYYPNETGEINGVFNIVGRNGMEEKEIVVYTDDITQSKIKLLLKIKIFDPMGIKPRLLHWEKNSAVAPKNIILTIADPHWNVESIVCEKDKFTLRQTGEKGRYIIEVKPVSTKANLRDIIKIELKNDTLKKKTFLIHALIK